MLKNFNYQKSKQKQGYEQQGGMTAGKDYSVWFV